MVATNETAELAIVGERMGQVIIVTHHFRNIAVGVEKSLQNLIDAWQATSQATWLAALTTDYTLTKVRARHICGGLPLDATVEETVNSAGTRADASERLAPWFAVVVRERTASAGRSYRGRFYFPLCAENDFAGATITAAHQITMQAYVTTLTNGYIGVGATNPDWALVVHSKKLASVPGTQCNVSSTLVDTLSLQTTLTTQRSRRARPV